MSIIRKETSAKISRVVIHNETVYLCGQVALDPDADMAGQTHSVLARIDGHLAQAGTDKSKLLQVLIHVKNTEDAAIFNEIWNAWLPEDCAPARTCIQANMLRESLLVEVTVTAAR